MFLLAKYLRTKQEELPEGLETFTKTLEELEKMGLKAIWACDEENAESVRLAKRLGFANPVEYEFLYFPTRN